MWSLVKLGLKSCVKEKMWLIFNALFPIVLMSLLGGILSNAFNSSSEIDKISVYFYDDGNELSKGLITGIKDNLGEENIVFKEIDTLEEGKDMVRKDNVVFISLDGNNVDLYYSDKTPKEGGVIFSILNSVNKTIDTISMIYEENPQMGNEIVGEMSRDINLDIQLIEKEKAPDSFGYYGVVELTMMIMYTMLFPLGLLTVERRSMLKDRIFMASVKKSTYYISRVIVSTIISIGVLIPGYIFSIAVFNVNWGENPFITFLYLIPLNIFVTSIGILIGVGFKDYEKATSIIQGLIIPAMSFLGGAYVAFPTEIDGIFGVLTKFSPLRWVNNGVFDLAYGGSYETLNKSVLINLGLAIIMFGITIILHRREEKLS